MTNGKTHRSYVSYIDKSRIYYEAHGYDRAYRWAHHEDVPFTRLEKALNTRRIGLVTTADKRGDDAGGPQKLFAADNTQARTLVADKAWDRDATHLEDPETYLPVRTLQAIASTGRIGSLSPRFYAAATSYSQRLTKDEDAPQIEAWMREDQVDAALLIAI